MDHGEALEIQDEIRRVTDRFYVAVLLDIVTRCCRRHFGLELKETTKGRHVAVYWAEEFNFLADLCFLTVMIVIVRMPTAMERMRRVQPELDLRLGLGIVFLSISLSFLAYLRWFDRCRMRCESIPRHHNLHLLPVVVY